MSTKLQRHGFFCSSSSNRWVSRNSVRNHLSIIKWGISRKRCLAKLVSLDNGKNGLNIKLVGHGKHYSTFRKSRRMGHCSPSASAEDGITVNGSSQTGTSSDLEEMRVKLKQSLQGEDFSNGLVQFLNDAARVFELAIKEQGLFSKLPWFSTAWLGVDRNAWVKTLSYQASVYCLLQAASEISSRGDNRDRDVNVFVQRSLLRQSAPLESLIREKLSAKQPEFYNWFSTEQVPAMVSSFVHYFEGDPQFSAATAMCGKGASFSRGSASDISLLMLALTCLAAITKLGPAKVSCLNFSSMIPDITGRLMDMLVDFVPIYQAYISMKDIGLRREFLVHFGPRATECRVNDDRGSEEVSFWVDLVQNQLQRAIDREKIWSRLTTSESIEVLDRDLAIFGFFIALGRSTKSFLSANGFEVLEGPIEGFIRYLIGGSVLFYPQLSSISSYQLYVEVVCEELDWLPFYPGNSDVSKQSHGHRSKREGPPNAEAIPQVLDVCSHWIESFIKYSTWLENPSNVKAAKFLSRGHNKLMECKEELRLSNKSGIQTNSVEWAGSAIDMDSDSFNKALESVEEALNKLENLLEELHVDSSYSGKEQLKEACSDLEKIRKLKKEAEFLEASFRAKAASLQQDDDDDDDSSQSSITEQQQYWKGRYTQSVNVMDDGSDRSVKKSRGFWSSLTQLPFRKDNAELTAVEKSEDEVIQQSSSIISATDAEPNEIDRFEQLRNELMELEKRVKKSADQSENEELTAIDVYARSGTDAGDRQLVKAQKKENIIGKSLDKLKETSTDVLQGTQLLAIDAAAATGLLRRVLIGDDLTEKEKQALKRTLTDLASVVPIGILMLLPVTAVGHAAMLAAIQRYVPSLIPSTYGTERLDLLRQLEKMKEMETSEPDPEENVGELI